MLNCSIYTREKGNRTLKQQECSTIEISRNFYFRSFWARFSQWKNALAIRPCKGTKTLWIATHGTQRQWSTTRTLHAITRTASPNQSSEKTTQNRKGLPHSCVASAYTHTNTHTKEIHASKILHARYTNTNLTCGSLPIPPLQTDFQSITTRKPPNVRPSQNRDLGKKKRKRTR